jgi:hypothetical protein
MPRFTLTSKSKPQIRGGQQESLYEAMQALGGSAMFDEIAAMCKEYERRGKYKVKHPVTIHASVMHHLHQWEKRDPPIVKVQY